MHVLGCAVFVLSVPFAVIALALALFIKNISIKTPAKKDAEADVQEKGPTTEVPRTEEDEGGIEKKTT